MSKNETTGSSKTQKTKAPTSKPKKASSPSPVPAADSLRPLFGARCQGESDNAVLACNDWLRLGRFRSLRRLLAFYDDENSQDALLGAMSKEERELLAEENAVLFGHPVAPSIGQPTEGRPTETYRSLPNASIFPNAGAPALQTLKEWSAQFQWAERARLFDSVEEAERTARRRAVEETGLANSFARVQLLKAIGQKLRNEIFVNGIFLTRSITTISTNGTEKIECNDAYNSALVNDLIKILDDIAKETGGRSKTPSLEADLKALEARIDYSKLTPDQRTRIQNRETSIVEVLLEEYLLPDEAQE